VLLSSSQDAGGYYLTIKPRRKESRELTSARHASYWDLVNSHQEAKE
jgi:hypothetical protein